MLNSLLGLVKDVGAIAIAPVEIAVAVTRAVTKPVAEVATEAVKEIKDATGTNDKKGQ